MTNKLNTLLIWFLLVCLLPVPALAQNAAEYPTLAAIDAADVPPRDLIDLAQRINGVTDIAPPPVAPAPLAVGTVASFWVDNSYENRSFEVDAELKVVGEHIYLWVQTGENLRQADLQRLADEFDTMVYDKVRNLWGSEPSPGVDGDPRVHGLFARDLGPGVGAYFAAKHAYPIEAVPTSNEREMFFFNLDAIEYLLGDFSLTSITAHEFQHMIRANVDSNEDGWMDEGFSEFTQYYLGDGNLFAAFSFQANPNTQLNTWTEDGDRTADYGASGMWVAYLHERFGVEGLNELSADPANGMIGVENLARQHSTTADELFADWVVANLLLDAADPLYGYTLLQGLTGPRILTTTNEPLALTINQYAANYIGVPNVRSAETLQIDVTAPVTVGLAPMQSPSGTPMWYSNRGDDSNTRLTFPADLTDAQNPMLTFDLWYHIENLWDYGYVMVSTDGGATWDIQQTDEMTTENPHFNAYGAGYTGKSGGGDNPVWVTERVPLADYAGQEVLVRFEMIYDDAVNQPGMFIDAVQISDDATGSTLLDADFSAAPAWNAEGWLLTDNQLPQQVWVQAVQQHGDEHTVTRWLLTGGSGSYTLPLVERVDQVVIVVSPFAPKTTVPAEITLDVRTG